LLGCIIVDLPYPGLSVDPAGLNSSVAMASDGRFVVVWSRYEGDEFAVFGRRYSADGDPAGDSFQVNTTPANWLASVSVAMAPDGRFAVVWGGRGPEPNVYAVFGRSYNADGSTAGFEFFTNTYTNGDRVRPSVAMACDGTFALVWSGYDGDGIGVFGRRYTPEGNPLGPEFQVNTYTTDDQTSPSVAMACDGRFAAAWASNEQDGDQWGVYGQRYTADHNPAGTEFRVNTNTPDRQRSPVAAMADDGRLVVVWESWHENRYFPNLYGQRYAADGSTVGTEFRVHAPNYGSASSPSVAMTPDGRLMVAWTSRKDGDQGGISCRRFAADGTAMGADFVVNTFRKEVQNSPSVAAADDGRFVVVWRSGAMWEPEFSGIFAQLYDHQGERVVP
jgi:hypothetical protein